MGLKTVIPDMEQTFGVLYYAGPGEKVSWSIGGIELAGQFYNFFSEELKGENVEALILAGKKEMPFSFGEPVLLAYPRVMVQNYKTESGGLSTLLLMADDIREIGSWQDAQYGQEEAEKEICAKCMNR